MISQLRRPCEAQGCEDPRAYFASLMDAAGDPVVLIGTCAAHLHAAVDRCVLLAPPAAVEPTVLTVTRTTWAGDPDLLGPFEHVDLVGVSS